MAIGCGAKCAKIMLIVFNIIFWLSGCGILAVGIWLCVDPTMVNLQSLVTLDSSDATLKYAAYVLIGVGVFVFIVGFFGCCGALRESKCMLGTYIFCLVIVLALELVAGILAVVYQADLKAKLHSTLQKSLITYSNGSLIATTWDYVQLSFECCGDASYQDYKNSTYYKTKLQVPHSCCVTSDPAKIDLTKPTFKNEAQCQIDARLNLVSSTSLQTKGCYQAVWDWIDANFPIIIGVGIGIACLEIFGFIFAVCLCRNVGEEE